MGKSRIFLHQGQVFDRLMVVEPETRKGSRRAALCNCSCGTTGVLVQIGHLTGGRVRSCGCIRREQIAERNRVNARRDGATTHPLWPHWAAIMNRCYNPAAGNYHYYGGRGIAVWEPWRKDPFLFFNWIEQNLGPRPSPKHSVDRKDNDGDYKPGNLAWADPVTQARNRRPRQRRA